KNGVGGVRDRIRLLLDGGLVQVLNSDAPRLQWIFQSPPAIWDAIRGDVHLHPTASMRFRAAEDLPSIGDVVGGEVLLRALHNVQALIESGHARTVVVRGPQHNGRGTIAGAIAGALGRGVLELRGGWRADDERWSLVSALATLAHAMVVIVLDLGLGETAELPPLRGFRGPVAVVLGRHGALSGELANGALTLSVPMPSVAERGT